MILDYNKGKGTVDISDQIGAYNNPLRKSLKWYRKLAFELLLTTAVLNTHFIYKEIHNEDLSIMVLLNG